LQFIISQCGAAWRGVAKGVMNYKTLLDKIERANRNNDPVCLVTFNYDTLLEDALSDFDLPIKDFADYTQTHAFYRVFKVHGSVNWARILDNKMQSQNPSDTRSVAREWIRRAAELKVTEEYVLCSGFPTAVVGGRPAFPAIAIPVEKEKTFECPANLIEELKTLLPHVTKVLVIGWRASEDHFLDLLKARLRPGVNLHVVAKGIKDAGDSMARICRALTNNRPADVSNSDEGFTDFIVSGAVDIFLQTRVSEK
jgi:hypothetical protein